MDLTMQHTYDCVMLKVYRIIPKLSGAQVDGTTHIQQALGENGPGYWLERDFIDAHQLASIQQEFCSARWTVPTAYFRNRPNVTQDYSKISLVLVRGNQDIIEAEFSAVRSLAERVSKIGNEIVRSSCGGCDFVVNDIDLHRYAAGSLGLGRHRDYPRNPYIIAIATVDGSGVLEVDQKEVFIKAGDLVLMRTVSLYVSEEDIRPWHALTPGPEGRDCVVLRYDPNPANTKPYDTTYDNWPDQFDTIT